jgi:hypothetical protein
MRLFDRIIISLFLFIAILTLESCWEEIHPDNLKLPEITDTGENTFGCLINGEVWSANGPPGCWNCGPNPKARLDASPTNDTSASAYRNDILYLGARNAYSGVIAQNLNIVLLFADSFEIGKPIDLNNKNSGNIQFWDELNNCILIESDSTSNAYVQINKYDEENGIVSGIFEGTLSDTCQTLEITNGRFDLTFRTN